MAQLLGDYLKNIEADNQTYLERNVPVYARLDGKGFSKFTKGMERPFDAEFTDTMTTVAHQLMETTRADLAYVQSDEISLYWKPMLTMDYDGRKEKWIGELSGLATAAMMREVAERFPGKETMLPRFDCRVFNVSKKDALRFFHWRYLDCKKNSVSMVAYHYMSHKSLINVPTRERIERLIRIGHPWHEYSDKFKFGTLIYKVKRYLPVDKSKIPEYVRGTVPDYAERNVFEEFHMPIWDEKTVDSMVYGNLECSYPTS